MKNNAFTVKKIALATGVFLALATTAFVNDGQKANKKTPIARKTAPTPPLGWNSFDAYDCRINEQEFKANVDVIEKKLLPYGFNYAVVDYIWFHDEPGNWQKPGRRFGHPDIRYKPSGEPIDKFEMDEYGRLWPSRVRFPSAKDGKGFKAIADYVHAKGMKFGIHIMRGIPRQAWWENTPIKGTNYKARDIAEPWDTCNWNNNMFGVDATKPGAQEYYNSLFELYAAWGVDFIKADDTMYPPYHAAEIELIKNALMNCGRPMVLSLSCGEAPLSQANHVSFNSNMWRISADFWDNWKSLKHNFDLLNAWSPFIGEGQWPDGDMLPIGKLSLNNRPHGPERMSEFTWDEQHTLINLWCMARSPLMLGADMLSTPDSVFALLQNKELIYINQHSTDNRQVWDDNGHRIWIATDPKTGDRFVGLFNLNDDASTVKFHLELETIRLDMHYTNLVSGEKGITNNRVLSKTLAPHASAVYRLSAVKP